MCAVAASKLADVKSMWATLLEVNLFYKYTPKRAQSLAEYTEVHVQDSEDKEFGTKRRKLVDLYKTRWTARHEAVTFSELYPAVVTNLEYVNANEGGHWNPSTRTSASSLLNCLTQFKFVAAFVIVSKVMSYIQSLSAAIQERAIDVVKAYGLVDRVADRLRRLHETVQETRDIWWKELQLLATSLNVVEVIPRQCLR